MSIIRELLGNRRPLLPVDRHGFDVRRWLLLEGNRLAVTIALLLFTFIGMIVLGMAWTFEMQRLLTETQAVQSLLNTLLSGIILLVSIVVSINSIVLSYDITSLDAQQDRIKATTKFRRDAEQLTDEHSNPTDPKSFLQLMTGVIQSRAQELEKTPQHADREFAEEMDTYTQNVLNTVNSLNNSLENINDSRFGALWQGLEVDYGAHLNQSDRFVLDYEEAFSETYRQRFDELIRAFELFAMGKEYFKTLYYTREVSKLSRVLLGISLPTILFVASATLAIEAHLLPDFWLLGLPPLLTFVSFVFTISLAPFAVLTAYMLRIATVARRTASAGPFTLM